MCCKNIKSIIVDVHLVTLHQILCPGWKKTSEDYSILDVTESHSIICQY